MQLRFTSFAVINLRWDLHPQECARAGRTKQKTRRALRYAGFSIFIAGGRYWDRTSDPCRVKAVLYR